MSLYLGIDVGTTKTAAVLLDTNTGLPVAVRTVANANQVRVSPSRSEWDARAGLDLALEVAREVVRAAEDASRVGGIGVTGQMHGVVVVDEGLSPLTPLIGWQDKRCDEPAGGFPSTIAWIQHLGGSELLEGTGCRLATGYLGPTLFWLARNGQLPQGTAAFLPDYVVAWLCQQRPLTDPTNAASSGVYDIARRRWHEGLLMALDLPLEMLPSVLSTGTVVGRLAQQPADALGLPVGLPVMNAMGDNQASFFSSVAEPERDLLINIGTGGQISATIPRFVPPDVLETRPFLGENYLLVGAGMTGGNAYAAIRDFFVRIGQEVFGAQPHDELYGILNRLAQGVAAGSDGLRCDPRFVGTRHSPLQRGAYSGISPSNLTPGHFVRSLFEGMAETFWSAYVEMRSMGLAPRRRLVGSGNGIRRNPLLAHILSERFGMPLVYPQHSEEAATGAALLAAVATGEIADAATAGKLIQYVSEQPAATDE